MRFHILVVLCFLSLASPSFAKLSIVTTTTDLKAITEEVAGELASVEGIAKGTQDPHFIEAKPSFMVKASHADLLVAVGLDLEVGWLPSILQGARNPKIIAGSSGYFEVGPLVTPLEVPTGKLSRADGDVHPFGNPHVTLDPVRAGEIAISLAKKLAELDPGHSKEFTANAQAFDLRLKTKTKDWQTRIKKTGVSKVVTYHKTLTYFLDRFQITNPAILEPKPGIPPTSGHIIEVIEIIKNQKVPLVLIENFFDDSVTKKLKSSLVSIRTETVPVAVDGAPNTKKLDDLYEHLVLAIEGK